MTPTFTGIALATALTLALAAPVAADPGRGRHYDNDRNHAHQGCPPGLAKKSPSCVPPGQAKRDDIRYGRGVGDRLRVEDYVLVRDLNRYHVERREGWRYYRSDDQLYRVDTETRQILAVINLARALFN